MKKLLVLLFIGLIFQSCATFIARYSVGLSSVERPVNAKHQFGETKIVNFNDGNLTKYRYEDDYIDVVWYVSLKQFNFELKNKSGHTIKINWDDVSYVDIEGKTRRVMHAGVKYADRTNSQPATTIPNNATISDILLPTDNVYYVSPTTYTSGGWREKNLIPSTYKTREQYDAYAKGYVGKKMKILMPIMIENVQNEYIFEFSIDKLL